MKVIFQPRDNEILLMKRDEEVRDEETVDPEHGSNIFRSDPSNQKSETKVTWDNIQKMNSFLDPSPRQKNSLLDLLLLSVMTLIPPLI